MRPLILVAWPNNSKSFLGALGPVWGRSWHRFSCLLVLLAVACLAKAPPDANKRPPVSTLEPFWPPKIVIYGISSLPRVFRFSLRCSTYFRHAAALNSLPFATSAKHARMLCDPQKLMYFYDLSLLAASPGACHASKKKAKIKAKTLTQKPSNNY